MKIHVRSAMFDVVFVEIWQLRNVAEPGRTQFTARIVVSKKSICDRISLLLAGVQRTQDRRHILLFNSEPRDKMN
jgi:hypothetical protein